MHDQLVTRLLPPLTQSADEKFDVFAVMRHGTYEKQLSNIFAWLLDAEGSHRLGDGFQRIFIEEVSRDLHGADAITCDTLSVRQEVDISAMGDGTDIADILLEDHETTLVIENYYTSSGHGHSYDDYLNFGARGGKCSVVVMLCENENRNALTNCWQNASLVTYGVLLERLKQLVATDDEYQQKYPEQCYFYEHMHRRFVKGRRVNDENLVDFLDAMCQTGEAERFRGNKQEDAAIHFGDHLREEAVRQYGESLELLTKKLKRRLRDYCAGTLRTQVNDVLGADVIGDNYYMDYGSIWKWTVGLYRADDPQNQFLQLKFGPSAWYANEHRDGDFSGEKWEKTVPPSEADYTRLFLTWRHDRSIRQSTVSLLEILDGLAPDDVRLRDELVDLIGASR